MLSPTMVPRRDSDVKVLDIGPLSPTNSKPRVRFYDSAADAARLAKALSGSKSPDIDPLIEILPALTHEQILDLRVEYKKLVKIGGKGVNIAKHIKLRLNDEEPLRKACYAVALGQWESEAYWANFWYQEDKSRRELLIESLMGRTNEEIRAIKEGFSDKKYSDSLTKYMEVELRGDKFKKAVLLVLEERRMEDKPSSIDRKLVEEDVRELQSAVKSEMGGETTMINIIVLRSDSHIREILKVYLALFRANFAREMLKKSGNLVVCFFPVTWYYSLTHYRANFWLTSSTASSTGRSVTPYSSIMHYRSQNPTPPASNFSSLVSSAVIGTVRTWNSSRKNIEPGTEKSSSKLCMMGRRVHGVSSVKNCALPE